MHGKRTVLPVYPAIDRLAGRGYIGVYAKRWFEIPIPQPYYRGSFILDALAASISNGGIKLLVANPGANDFADTHSLPLIIDSLSLMAAMEKLSPSLTLETAGLIFGAMSNAAASASTGTQGKAEGDTLERMLDALRKLVLGAEVDPTFDEAEMKKMLVGNTWHDGILRAKFQDNLKDLRDYINSHVGANSAPFSLVSLVNTPAATLIAEAGNPDGMAYRYALQELNPFTVTGDTAAADFYLPKNLSGELELYNATDRTGMLTTNYIDDRAQLLARKIYYNARNARYDISNGFFDPNDAAATGYNPDDIIWTDVASKLKIQRGTITGSTRYIAFGGDSSDNITGGANADRLYSGGSTDVLIGKGGDDYLEGGAGLDIYQYGGAIGLLGPSNDGADIIRDIDGKGVLRYLYSPLTGAQQSTVIADATNKISNTEWLSADGKFTYTKEGADLKVTINGDASGTMTLKDFRDGDFYIYLRDARANPQNPTRTFYGDKQDYDSDGNPGNGIQTEADGLGNNKRADGQGGRPDIDEANREDVFYGSIVAGEVEFFQLGGGNDRALADGPLLFPPSGGVAWMQGGDGRDELIGGVAGDLIEGGADGVYNSEAGGDIAWGGLGNDELYADLKLPVKDAITAGASGTGSGVKGDFLSGGANDDWTIGGAGDDYVDGGSGNDVLVGGLGNDNLTGDAGYGTSTPLWTITRQTVTANNVTTYTLLYGANTTQLDAGIAGADVIYAGAGDDWVRAGAGDDYIDAGSGNDVMFGEAGADVLIGGAGNDLLVGDNPGLVAAADERGDYLEGGAGDDTLQGNGGADVLIGGAGVDVLSGGAGKDTYVFNLGDGVETIFDTDASSNSPDASVLILGPGVNRADIKFRVGSLLVDIGNGDQIHFSGFNQADPTASTPLAEIRLDDGSSVSYADILAQGFDIDGTEGGGLLLYDLKKDHQGRASHARDRCKTRRRRPTAGFTKRNRSVSSLPRRADGRPLCN